MYNSNLYAIVFMEVQSMNEALKIQLKILKLSSIKPNYSEQAEKIFVKKVQDLF